MRRIIKFGGSVITRAHPHASIDADNTARLANDLLSSTDGAVLVHGTGHVGKPFAIKNDFLRDGRIAHDQTQLVADIRGALRHLNAEVVNILCKAGIPAYGISPANCFDEDMRNFRHDADRTALLQQLKLGYLPVFYGDLMLLSDGTYQVFSSDRIAEILSRVFAPMLAIFLTDVAGVYGSNEKGRRNALPMRELAAQDLDSVFRGDTDCLDVSGGMRTKVISALDIACHAGKCVIASGIEKGVLKALLTGTEVICTRVIGAGQNG